ncbi:hypothetical protein J1N35_037888 [Gossypium stocksii]|uniref:Uncharacterized protein n=1 Tax=Gossypium stocksii TaxID=47602 RepID=A0A9D3ZM38_9ROSI|nr:hypothetical protein J1N35_037888 [Gossypium stocksii]
MEKPALTAVTSTVTMGKSMESGFGIGCTGASVLRAPEDPMLGSSMGMGYGSGWWSYPRHWHGSLGYDGMNRQPMSMGMGMNMGMNPGMGVNRQPDDNWWWWWLSMRNHFLMHSVFFSNNNSFSIFTGKTQGNTSQLDIQVITLRNHI